MRIHAAFLRLLGGGGLRALRWPNQARELDFLVLCGMCCACVSLLGGLAFQQSGEGQSGLTVSSTSVAWGLIGTNVAFLVFAIIVGASISPSQLLACSCWAKESSEPKSQNARSKSDNTTPGRHPPLPLQPASSA